MNGPDNGARQGADRRDQAVDRLLRQSVKPQAPRDLSVCLDAETVAAWMDGSLTGAALDAAQMHAADCDRCQTVLAAFAQMNTPMPALAPASRRWLAWFVPLTAAAAVGIWALLPQPRPVTSAPDVTMARNDEMKLPAPPPEQNAERATPATPPSAAQPSSGSPAGAPSANSTAGSAALEDRQQPLSEQAKSLQSRAKTDAEGRLANASPPATSPSVAEIVTPTAPAPVPAPPPPAPPAAASAPSAAADAANGPSPARQETAAFARAAAAPVAQAPGSTVRWRLAGTGIERSDTPNAAWTTAYTAPSPLTSIVSPSATVVWAVGPGGLMVRAVDGRTFVRVVFPEPVDLVSVTATDASIATVTTADGRTFVTADAGATWRTRLQDF